MIRPLWAEINLKALRDNYQAIRLYVGEKTRIIAVVKQSAYGHGLIPVSRELRSQGVDFFGVASIEEAISLREDGFKGNIIVLTSILEEFVSYFLEYDLIPTVVDLGFAKKLNKEARNKNKRVPIHVKIDTGMGRLGPGYQQAHLFIKELMNFKNLNLEGIYTHFPVADTDTVFTNFQIEAFNQFICSLNEDNISFKYCHCANSMGIINYPNAHFNMVRPGLILYGIKPCLNCDLILDPVLTLKSKVVFVKKNKQGSSVGYGRTFLVSEEGNIATIAVGYADGYPWALSNRSKVIIKDKLFNIAGRVCMDHIMVDLKDDNDIKQGQEVILIGKSKNHQITVEELSQEARTIPYEIVSRLSSKIPRIYKYSKIEVKQEGQQVIR
ncbi:MAG: alanine racemase [Candidatus Omnitrophica bacterium]|nr:alanine racemase [Candidatus Omnitrophota bacterium]